MVKTVLLLLLVAFYKTDLINQKEYRLIELYNCQKSVRQTFRSFLKQEIKFNKIIKRLSILKKVPKFTKMTVTLQGAIKWAQEILYINYIANLSQLPKCQNLEVSNYLSPLPLERSGLLFKRDGSGQIRIKQRSRKILFSKYTKHYVSTFWEVKGGQIQFRQKLSKTLRGVSHLKLSQQWELSQWR